MSVLKCTGPIGAIAVLAITGCTTDATAPRRDDLASPDAALASLATQAVGEHLDMFRGQGLPGLGPPGLLFPPPTDPGSRCGRDGHRHVCPPMARKGLTFSRTITYYDSAGNPQDTYDSLTTASINFYVLVTNGDDQDSGEVRAVTIRNERDLTVSGLLGLEMTATWNGMGTSYFKMDAPLGRGPGHGEPGTDGRGPGHGQGRPSDPPRRGDHDSLPPHPGRPPRDSAGRSEGPPFGEGRTIEATASFTIDNVVVPVPQTQDGWPLSGSITQDATVTITLPHGESRTASRTAVVTFNGTQFVPLVINGDTTIIDLRERPRFRFGLPRDHP